MIGTGPVPREEQSRGWRIQRKKDNGERLNWNSERSCGDRYCVILCVSRLRAEAHETGLRWDSEQACVCRERYGAGHCRVMMLGKKSPTGDSDSGFFSGT